MLIAFLREDKTGVRYLRESGGIARECAGDGCGGICGQCLL